MRRMSQQSGSRQRPERRTEREGAQQAVPDHFTGTEARAVQASRGMG